MTEEDISVEYDAIEKKLRDSLEPIHLDLVDLSASSCGKSYSAVIVSEKFNGKPLLQRHRMVNDALKKELGHIHAFTMKTLTTEQWQKQKSQ
eukprot:gene14411-15913_t